MSNKNPNPNLLAHRVFPNGVAIALTRNGPQHFIVEIVAHRLLDGQPWYPTLDSDLAESELEARELYEEAEYRWEKADEEEMGSEVLAAPEEWDRSSKLEEKPRG